MNFDPRAFKESAHDALNDAGLKSALGRLKTHFALGRRIAISRYGDFEALREAGRAARDYAIANLDTLLETFERNVSARGGQVHWARDAAEAREIILSILRDAGATTVTKGKSMVTEEIALNPFLEANGITPVETDLGEYIIQLRHEPPSHIIAPAFHLHKEQVAQTFRAAHTSLDPDRSLDERQALVAEARTMLRARFEAADAGITGANFLSAAEGAAVIVTNEGNGDLTRLLPRTHIVVTGIEKVVADLDDVAVLLRLLTRSATGQEISSYVSVMAGPREREGGGPTAFHVVLVDNGRSALIGTEAQEVLRCIRCSACLNHCPIYGAVGGHAYGATYSGPIGAALNPGMMGLPAAYHHPNASTFCGRCAEVCPVKIPLPTIMRHWRAKEYADGLAPRAAVMGLGIWAFAARRPALYRFGARIAARVLKLLAGGRGAVHALPLMGGWFAVRDFPSPTGPHVPRDVGEAMSARDEILSSIRARTRPKAPKPQPYPARTLPSDLVALFTEKAKGVNAEIRMLEGEAEIPSAIAELLRARNMAATIHLPPHSDLADIAWDKQLSVERGAPGPDDAAVTRAPLAIAETGTLVQPAREASPASWHFRPGFEIAILRARDIAANFEAVLAKLKAQGPLPATINLITGPSRTGDIEQTLELGAHGPKALAILIVRD